MTPHQNAKEIKNYWLGNMDRLWECESLKLWLHFDDTIIARRLPLLGNWLGKMDKLWEYKSHKLRLSTPLRLPANQFPVSEGGFCYTSRLNNRCVSTGHVANHKPSAVFCVPAKYSRWCATGKKRQIDKVNPNVRVRITWYSATQVFLVGRNLKLVHCTRHRQPHQKVIDGRWHSTSHPCQRNCFYRTISWYFAAVIHASSGKCRLTLLSKNTP